MEIDSALTKGNYRKGGLLLDEYEDQLQTAESESTENYHKLMRAFWRYRVGEEPNDIGQMDSLCIYYGEPKSRNTALSLLIMGDAYRHAKDYPAALECCLRAETLAAELRDDGIRCWTFRQEGIIYKSQHMYDDAERCFRAHGELARRLNDSRQMLMSAHDMGFVYTAKGDVDSTISSYNQCIELAKSRSDSSLFLPQTRERLYDIYIQIGAYDSVKNVMPRDSMNYDNWAYYYKGTGETDSAAYYFRKCLHNYSVYTDRRCLHELIGIEKRRGNLKEAIALYEQLEETDDSIRRLDHEAETKRTQARYDYELMKRQRDALAMKKKQEEWITTSVLVALAVILLSVTYYFNTRRKEKQAARRVLSKSALQAAEHRLTEAGLQRQQQLLEELQASELYRRIRQNAGNRDFRLTEDEWQQLATCLDKAYDNLTERMQNLANLSQTEMRVVYLLKLEVAPADMGTILSKSKSAVSMIRTRMHEKILGQRGSATDLDEFIRRF